MDNSANSGSESADLESNLEAIGEAFKLVEKDSHSYEGYNTLISCFKAMGSSMAEELQNIRTTMSSVLLLSEDQWIEWIEDSFLPKELVPVIYAEAVKDLPTVSLWTKYANYLVNKYSAEEDETSVFSYNKILSVLSIGADTTKYRIPDSHIVWNIYRDFVSINLESDSKKAETVAKLKQMYLDRLAVPHLTISDTFSDYSTFITAYDNDHYEQELVRASKIYAGSLKTLQARDQWESALASNNSLENYAGYIQWEASRPKKLQDPNLVIGLYERVLGDFPREFAEIWDDYVAFLCFTVANPQNTLQVLNRATKACPESGELWAHKLRILEVSNASDGDIFNVKDTVDTIISFKQPQNYKNWKLFTMAWLFFLMKQYRQTQDEEVMVQFITDADAAFLRAVEQGRDDVYFEMEKFLIEQWTILIDLDQARTIWNRVSKYHGKTAEFWVKWVVWERLNGDYTSVVGVFVKALTRNNLDWPERIFHEYVEYERSYGSFYSIQHCIAQCRAKLKYYQEQRSQQYAKEQESQDQQMTEAPVEEASSSSKRARDEPSNVLDSSDRPSKTQKKDAFKTKLQDAADSSRDREHNTVIVSNLDQGIKLEDLRRFFADCGEIKDINLNSNKNIATIEFGDNEGALAAMTRHLKRIGSYKNEIHIQSGQSTTLWVTNFPPSETDDSLRQLFSSHGQVLSIRFPSLKFNTHRRFCYIQFSSASEAFDAMTALNGKELSQQGQDEKKSTLSLVVKISDPQKKTDRTGAIYEDREVFVKGIDFKSVDESRIRKLFEPYGSIERIRLPLSQGNKKQGRLHDGYCFIVLETAEAAQKSVIGLNGVELESRTIHVSIAAKSGTKISSKVVGNNTEDSHTESESNVKPSDINARTLVVTNLADTINDTQLSNLFSQYGALKKIILRPENGSATVEFNQVQV